ncbi:Zinc finger C2H2 type [Fasciola hepatica]|uniref:Zinc finger C2H2 type n=1 Tax=Fasciola hepatica TaxID=6192 RepID=A0A4E0RYI3_FASHE|nr:Zinc finger C2H2 type [Fasciola hepatica]
MTFLRKLLQRELTSRPSSLQENFVRSRSYQLSRILPRTALDDVFLGFSVCGQFLISYKMDFKRFLLRFWSFPPQPLRDENGIKLRLFAEAPFFHSIYVSRFQDTPCVRFIQSKLDFRSFLLLSCDYDGDGVIAAYGSMPDVDCEHCMSAHLRLSGILPTDAPNSRQCPIHLQILLLNLDLPIMSDRTPCAFDTSTTDPGPLPQSNHQRIKNSRISTTSDCIPPCLQIYGSSQLYVPETEKFSSGCGCFASTPWPIGGIQLSVCATNGALRLSWASPDAQIKIISCRFTSTGRASSFGEHLRVYPQGTSSYPDSQVAPFAFKNPLLTHNYCSRCYSWPTCDTQPCQLTNSASSAGFDRLDASVCIFRQKSRVALVADADHWPDNHRPPEIYPPSCTHVCMQSRSSNESHQHHPIQSVAVPAFLFHRPTFTCCRPLTYLTMMGDIRASYVHWTLLSRVPSSFANNIVSANLNRNPLGYHQSTNELTDEETEFFVGSQSSGDNEDEEEEDPVAMIASPDSIDQTQSPEDLLAHRLSGQCHTSFDLTYWQELGTDPWTNITFSTDQANRAIAHLEEVVFDIPMDQENVDRSSSSADDLSILLLFLPVEEPELLLIYQTHHSCGHVPTHATSIKLYGAIDLTTGEYLSVSLDSERSGVALRSHNNRPFTLSVDRLRELTARCPYNTANVCGGIRPNLVHELNNIHMTSRLESLKLLVDPQGGYEASGIQHCSTILDSIVHSSDATKQLDNNYTISSVLPTTIAKNRNENEFTTTTNSSRIIRCDLNYDTLPTILFYCLPTRTQRLIGHRVKKSQCPLFVLVTSLHGQWCLVQLTDSDETENQTDPISDSSNQTDTGPEYTESRIASEDANERTTSVDCQSERIAALRVNLDDHSLVDFSDSGASFQFTVIPGDSAWHCPFCGASFSLDNSSALSDLLTQHLRLHVELRCCMDCATILPNNTLNMELDNQTEHTCSQLVSSLNKNQTTKSTTSLPFSSTAFLQSPLKSGSTVLTVPGSNVIPIRIHSPRHSIVGDKKVTLNCNSSVDSVSGCVRPAYTVIINPEKSLDAESQSKGPTVTATVPCKVSVHSNQSKVFECHHCSLQLKTSAQYQQHLKNVHRGNRFVCQECAVSFSTKGNLTTHFQQVHNRSTAMRCPVCEKRLSNKYNIERHMRFVHGANQTTHQSSSEAKSGASSTGSQTSQLESPLGHPLVRSLELNDPLSECDPSNQMNRTTGVETSRGFYLYLSTPDQTDTAVTRNTENPAACLVAEVQMTPCQPSNPNAQYGTGGTTWRPCVRVAEPWLVNSTNSGPSNSSPECPPPT